jgi:hypothetical protein
MFDLSIYSYYDVLAFLKNNLKNIEKKTCVNYEHNVFPDGDLYELIIISIEDEYFDDPNKSFNKNEVLFGNCYYYILNYNDEKYCNELSVIDCGGYYIAVCIFKNKINITNEIIYNKNYCSNGDDYIKKFHMNTLIGNKYEIIPKNLL